MGESQWYGGCGAEQLKALHPIKGKRAAGVAEEDLSAHYGV